MTARPSEVEDYVRRSDHYWRQALERLKAGQWEKASELAWGSVVERVKALARLWSQAELRSHREVREFIKRAALQNADEALYRAFREAESLHINFYESFFDPEEVRQAFVAIQELLARLDSYLHPASGPAPTAS